MKSTIVKLGDACEFIRGVTYEKTDADNRPAKDRTPVLRAGNIADELDTQNDLVWVPDMLVSDEQLFRKNDVVICMSSGSSEVVGKTATVRQTAKVSVGSFCGIIRPTKASQSRYLSFFFRSSLFRSHRDSIARGANIQNLRFSQFETIELGIPDDAERIAAILERADRLRRLRRYALEMTEEFLPAAFLRLFGDAAQRKRNWPEKTLEEVVQPDRGVTYGIVQAGANVPDGVPYIRTGDIVDGQIQTKGLLRTSTEIAASYKRSEVKFGDLVFSIRATVGTVALLPKILDGANLTQGTARIAPNEAVDKRFLLWQLRTREVQQWVRQQVKGSTFLEITLARLREMPVFVPPPKYQQQFAQLAERHERIAAIHREALRQAEHLFQTLLHRAFTSGL